MSAPAVNNNAQAPAVQPFVHVDYSKQTNMSDRQLITDITTPRAISTQPPLQNGANQYIIDTSLKWIAVQVSEKGSPVNLQVLQLLNDPSVAEAAKTQIKTALKSEIDNIAKSLNCLVPDHLLAPIMGPAPVAGTVVAPELSNEGWMGLSIENMLKRDNTFHTISFPRFEQSMFLGLGGLPRLAVAIHTFAVALFYSVLHFVPSCTSKDTEAVQGKNGELYHRHYAKFYGHRMVEALKDMALSLILSLPVVGAFYAHDREARLEVAAAAVQPAVVPQPANNGGNNVQAQA